jgi:hypothetical protein
MKNPYLIKSSARPNIRLFFSCVRKDAVEWLVTNTLRALNSSVSGNLSGTRNIFLALIS